MNRTRRRFARSPDKLALESAYAHHVRASEVVQKRIEDGMEFLMLMNGAGEGMFRLVYVYGENGLVRSAHIEELPASWKLRKDKNEHPLIFVTTDRKEVYSFDLTKPFTAIYWGPLESPPSRPDKPEGPTEI